MEIVPHSARSRLLLRRHMTVSRQLALQNIKIMAFFRYSCKNPSQRGKIVLANGAENSAIFAFKHSQFL